MDRLETIRRLTLETGMFHTEAKEALEEYDFDLDKAAQAKGYEPSSEARPMRRLKKVEKEREELLNGPSPLPEDYDYDRQMNMISWKRDRYDRDIEVLREILGQGEKSYGANGLKVVKR